MGELKVDLLRETVAVFKDGVIYKGSSTWGAPIGYYRRGRIEDAQHNWVASYSSGEAHGANWLNGNTLCCAKNNEIYEGGSSWNSSLCSFEGDPDGACAAAVLYFSLYDTESKNNVEKRDGGNNGRSDAAAFWGAFVLVSICLFMIYVFWFTEEGKDLLFKQIEGMIALAGCMLAVVVGSIRILKKRICKLSEIAGEATIWYGLALVIVWIMGLFVGELTFGYFLLVLFFSPIIVVGAAAPIFLVQVLVLWSINGMRKKEKLEE